MNSTHLRVQSAVQLCKVSLGTGLYLIPAWLFLIDSDHLG